MCSLCCASTSRRGLLRIYEIPVTQEELCVAVSLFLLTHYSRFDISFIGWSKVFDYLEPLIAEFKTARVATARKALLSERKAMIIEIYNQYQKSITEDAWSLKDDFWDDFPLGPELVIYEPFATMLNAPSDVNIQPTNISREIPRFIKHWPPQTMHDLEVFYPSISDGLRRSASLGLGTCNIDAVACVFTCPGCTRELGALSRGSLLFGWSAAAIHRTCRRLEPGEPLKINERACAATSALVAMLDLDPQTTEVQELDRLKALLRCATCPAERGVPKLFGWRECVSPLPFHHTFTGRGLIEWMCSSHIIFKWRVIGRIRRHR